MDPQTQATLLGGGFVLAGSVLTGIVSYAVASLNKRTSIALAEDERLAEENRQRRERREALYVECLRQTYRAGWAIGRFDPREGSIDPDNPEGNKGAVRRSADDLVAAGGWVREHIPLMELVAGADVRAAFCAFTVALDEVLTDLASDLKTAPAGVEKLRECSLLLLEEMRLELTGEVSKSRS